MFARVATFEGVDVAAARGTIEGARERLLLITREMPGWQGVLQLTDAQSGKVMTISLFDTEENMQAAEETFESMPQQVPEVQQVAGRRTSVERFEVAGGVFRGQEL